MQEVKLGRIKSEAEAPGKINQSFEGKILKKRKSSMDINEGRKKNMEKVRQEARGGCGKGEVDKRGN